MKLEFRTFNTAIQLSKSESATIASADSSAGVLMADETYKKNLNIWATKKASRLDAFFSIPLSDELNFLCQLNQNLPFLRGFPQPIDLFDWFSMYHEGQKLVKRYFGGCTAKIEMS